jgi:hypothetical protein
VIFHAPAMKNSIEGFDTNFLVPQKFTQPDNFVVIRERAKYTTRGSLSDAHSCGTKNYPCQPE